MKKLRSILLIDDDESTNFLNRIIIRQAECAEEVLVFNKANKALEYVSENIRSLTDTMVLLDINMPVMNGWDFLKALNELMKGQHPAGFNIVILTSSINPDDQLQALSLDLVTDFRSKPLSVKVLHELINRHFVED